MSWYLVIRHSIDQTFHVSISLFCTKYFRSDAIDCFKWVYLNFAAIEISKMKIVEFSCFCVSDQQKKFIYKLVFKVIVYFLIFSFEKCKIIDGILFLTILSF